MASFYIYCILQQLIHFLFSIQLCKKMLTSKFNIGMTLSMILIVFFGPFFLLMTIFIYPQQDPFFNFLGLPFVTIMVLVALRIELPKIRKIEIDSEFLRLTSLVLKRKRSFLLDNLTGYKTQIQPGKGGYNESILIYEKNKCVYEISDLYFRNFEQIKKHIKHTLPNLGIKKFKYFEYLKERLFNH